MARLLYRDSNGREGAVELTPNETVYVGRGLECAIRSDDGMVSRRHSQVHMENGHFVIEDLGSSNGVFLNNTRVQKAMLGHADVVQCGSLMIRFVDEAQQQAAPVSPPPKMGGTMRLDPDDIPAAAPRERPGPSRPLPFGGPPAMPGTVASAAPALPYGGPPAMPEGRAGTAAVAVPAKVAKPAQRKPEPEPEPEPDVGESSTNARFDDDESNDGTRVRGRDEDDETRARDHGMNGSSAPMPDDSLALPHVRDVEEERTRDRDDRAAIRRELDAMTEKFEREVADGKRLRAELATVRDREAELRRQLDDHAEQVRAHEQVAGELRDEVEQARAELASAHGERGELVDAATSHQRDAARAQDEAARLRADAEQQQRQLAELARNKDDSWKQLNDTLAEVERLRQVIDEQERLLEERRLGMVAQDKVIQRLRATRASTASTPPPVGKDLRDIYEAINDALSALRDHAVVVQYEAPALGGDASRLRAVREAAEAIASAMDAAKRALRPLREMFDK